VACGALNIGGSIVASESWGHQDDETGTVPLCKADPMRAGAAGRPATTCSLGGIGGVLAGKYRSDAPSQADFLEQPIANLGRLPSHALRWQKNRR